jgi:alkanesulfonate monooxygenase SsuD/methylene tetrahydromethanopterin reductase-like flavin-dependent oxidoreductase (luciferase family)
MVHKPLMEFGYNPPCGERGYETIVRRDFLKDVHRACDIASQSFDSLWTSDHLNYGSEFRVECWTLLTWIAARYPGPRLGTVVLCNGFRNPALMAKMAASIQELSEGRLILGYGAGWHEGEHRAYGYDYPTPGRRIDMFEEGVEIMKRMWTDSPASFSGRYYTVDAVHCEPRPDPLPILMLGGAGERKTLRVVAKHADWWNMTMGTPEALQHKLDVLRGHCEAVGRDYDSIRKTLAPRFYIHKVHSKALEMAGDKANDSSAVIAGDPAAVREKLMELVELGFDYSIATFPQLQELDDMKLFAEEVMPYFR